MSWAPHEWVVDSHLAEYVKLTGVRIPLYYERVVGSIGPTRFYGMPRQMGATERA